MKDLKAIRGRQYILDLISEGEHEQQDFKYSIPDARKIARTVSAFANNSGGRLLVGVKDNGVIAGVRNEEDIYVIEQAARLYCRPEVEVQFTAFRTGEQQVVIRASVPCNAQRPVQAQEPDGSWRAYYRVADENICAHPLMVRAWRLAAADRRILLHSDGPERAILSALEARGSLGVAEAMLAAAASKRASESAITRLAALGIVEFRYRGGEFAIFDAR